MNSRTEQADAIDWDLPFSLNIYACLASSKKVPIDDSVYRTSISTKAVKQITRFT